MTARDLLLTRQGAVRAPWRLLFFIAAVVACGFVASALLSPILVTLYGAIGLGSVSTGGWIEVAALLGGHALALFWLEKRSWREVGLDRQAARPRILLLGLGIGTLAVSLPIALLIAIGWLDRLPGTAVTWGMPIVRITLVLLPAALMEELLTRGYIFSVLRDVWGWRWTLLVTSVAFSLLHLRNHGATAGSLVFVALAGIFLGMVLVATGSLYAAWLAHFGWNWAMAALFHTAVSGYPFEAPGYRYVDAGPDWATGGPWGPEGGLPAGLAMLVATGYLFARRARREGISR